MQTLLDHRGAFSLRASFSPVLRCSSALAYYNKPEVRSWKSPPLPTLTNTHTLSKESRDDEIPLITIPALTFPLSGD